MGANVSEFLCAIDTANNANSLPLDRPYRIYVGTGTYQLPQTVLVSRRVEIYGEGKDNTLFVYAGTPGVMDHMFLLQGTGIPYLKFDGVTLYGGRNHSTTSGGAAIRVISGGAQLIITNSVLEDNVSVATSSKGGAIYLDEGYVYIENSTFKANWANQGGALYSDSLNLTPEGKQTVIVKYTKFNNNRAYDNGGAIFNAAASNGNAGKVKVRNSKFDNNQHKFNPATPNQDNSTNPVRRHVASAISTWVTISAKKNYWTPSVPPHPTNYGVDTQDQLAVPPSIVFDAPQIGFRVRFIDSTGAWSVTEKDAIYAGSHLIGRAFKKLLDTDQFNGREAFTEAEAFNRIVLRDDNSGKILFIRANTTSDIVVTHPDFPEEELTVSISLVPGGQNGGCFSGEWTISATFTQQYVVCNRSVPYPSDFGYTAVHELGHLFDYRSDSAILEAIGGTLQNANFVLASCVTTRPDGSTGAYTVIGKRLGVWIRGENGWGSGPSATITEFQQNPAEVPLEAAADMYLNWVARYTSPVPPAYSDVYGTNGIGDPPSSGCKSVTDQYTLPAPSLPQPWQGFQNRRWETYLYPFDWGYPGDVRYDWMNLTIVEILTNNTGW